jgi:myo-inositol-1(or 4)-monophosphatase
MPASGDADPAATVDWLAFCRRAGEAVRVSLEAYPTRAEREREIGRGEGGDITLAVDAAAEDAVFSQLEALAAPATAISEERGQVEIAGGGTTTVVIDPIDGSLNAKRGLPFYAVSIAVASGRTMADVDVAYVLDLASGQEWSATRGAGAWLDGERLASLDDGPLELIGIETARPERVAVALEAIVATGARRVRAIGSVALTLCLVAAGSLDAMATLREVRSVDAAAAQLIVREAGGAVAFPGGGDEPLGASLDLGMRSTVLAARSPAVLDSLSPLR